MKKKPIVSVTYESERIHCYFCLPTSPELGFPVFSGFFSGRLMQWQIEWFYVPLVSTVSCAVFRCIESYKG